MKTKSVSETATKLTRKLILLAIIALALSASPSSRADGDCLCLRTWDNVGAGDWFNPLNWGPSHNAVPDCGLSCGHPWEVDINNGGTAQISGLAQTAEACETFIGKDNSQQSGKLSVDHGTLNQCGDMFVGYYGTGKLTITDGGLVSTQFGAHIAAMAGSNGAATVDGSNPDGRKSTWTVPVAGAALNVAGTNTSAGGTGLLTVTNDGRVTAASVHVWKSGTLTGNSTVTTTSGTTVEGTLAPNWTLTIDGNLTFYGTSTTMPTMQCNVTPANLGSVDVEVTATATLTGRVSVTMTGTFTPGTTYTLLNADGVVNGTFSMESINFPPGQNFTAKIQYDTHHVKLYLQPNT